MKQLTGGTRIAFLLFFASHIPISLMVDGQAFLPEAIYPRAVIDLVSWYSETFHDKLMARPFDTWFTAIVACELLLQVPFFIVACYALWSQKISGSGWLRTACLLYGAHTATTLVPILATIATDPETTFMQKGTLFGFYLPYLIFPVWLIFIAAQSDDVFDGQGGSLAGVKVM